MMTILLHCGIITAIYVAIMYVDAIKLKRGTKKYCTTLIRQSYRQGGKVLHRTVCNISKLPPQLIEQIRLGLRQGEAAGRPDGPLRVERQREYGVSYCLRTGPVIDGYCWIEPLRERV